MPPAFIVGKVLLTSVFDVAAFAQPAIGNAFLEGIAGVLELNEKIYGAPLFATAGIGLLLFLAGAILPPARVRANRRSKAAPWPLARLFARRVLIQAGLDD